MILSSTTELLNVEAPGGQTNVSDLS
jgi:hypothetical protein